MNREHIYRGDNKVSRSRPTGQYSLPFNQNVDRPGRIESEKDRGLVDEGRDDQSLRLSQFNESLTRRDSTSMKFEWKHLLGEPAKLVVINDNCYSLTNPKLTDGYGVNHTRLTSDGKHYQERGFSGLGRSERNVVSDNAKPRLGLSSRGLNEPRVCKSLARQSYNRLTLDHPVAYSKDDTNSNKQSGSSTGSAHISSGGDRLDAKMINSTVVHEGRGHDLRSNSHVSRFHIPFRGRHEDNTYREGWEIEKENVFSASDDLHTASVHDHSSHGCLPVTSNMKNLSAGTVSEYYEELPRQIRVRCDDPYLQAKKIRGDSDMKTSQRREQDKEVLDGGASAHASCGRELCCNCRSPLIGEDHKSLKMLPISEYGQHKVNYDHEGLFLEEDHGYVRSETFPSKKDIVLDETAHLNDHGMISCALREKEFPISFTRIAHISSSGGSLDAKMINSTVVHEGHDHNLHGNSHATKISPHHIPVQGKHKDYTYREDWEIEKDNVLNVSDNLHSGSSVQNHRSHDCIPVTCNLDAVGRINECCYEELPRESRVMVVDPYLQAKKIRGDGDTKVVEVLDTTSDHASCGRELYCNSRSPLSGEDQKSLKMLPLGEYGRQKISYDQEGLLLEDRDYVRSEIFPSKENDVLDETAQSNDHGRGSLALGEKEFPGSFIRCAHISSSGDRLDAKMSYSTVIHEGYGHNLRGNSHVTRISPHGIPVQGKHEGHTYVEDWEIEKENVFGVSDDSHTNASGHNHCSRDSLRVTSNLDSAVGRINDCCYEELPRESRVRYDDPYLQGNTGDNDMKTSYTREQDKQVLNCTSAHTSCGRELYCDRRSPHFGEDHKSLKMLPLGEYGQNKINYDQEGLLLEEDYGYVRSETFLSEENKVLDGTAGDFQQTLAAAQCYSTDQSTLTLKRKYGLDGIPSNNYIGNLILGDGEKGIGHYYQGVAVEELTAEDMAAFALSKKLKPSHSQLPQTERVYYETNNNFSSCSDQLLPAEDLSVSVPMSVPAHSSGSRDIKKRLGPRPQDCASRLDPSTKTSKSSVKKHLGTVEMSKPSIKQRLGSIPKVLHAADPGMKCRKSKKHLGPRPQDCASRLDPSTKTSKSPVKKRSGTVEMSKPSIKQRLGPIPKVLHTADPGMKCRKSKKLIQKVCHDYNVHAQKEEPSVTDVIPTKCKTNEKSKEFEQLVDSAYFRLVKQLNENASQRRRILEQGTAGSLNCIICGSESKEFADTKSLVMHAFYSQKAGFRSQHLGYHRALCMLMGWKSKMADGCPWFCESLSDTEASSLKQDLIIWPPVVIIHNSSLNSNDFHGRVIVSVEAFESILRGMGLVERIKVCRGRPANHSIMVVKFNSTLSGLEAAEKLHNFYCKTKHGKVDFENISSCGNSHIGEAPMALEKKPEHVLYGYLGIADDLDKLDFETKKRCLVKSKKEIHRIADAQLVN